MYNYPYGDSQQLNLDWIIAKLKELEQQSGSGGADLEEVANALISLTYDTSTTYRRYDYCFRNGKLYRCLSDTTGAFDPDAWQEALIGDDLAVLTRWINAINASVDTLENAVKFISPTIYGAVYDGTTDCTSAIQAAINNANGKTVKFAGNGTAIISSPIVIKEDTHIELDKGFTLKMADYSDCPMFKNAPSDIDYNDPQAGQNIQHNISIVGGTLDFNGNNQNWQSSDYRLSAGIVLADVDNLIFSDLHIIDPITFACLLSGITHFTVEDIFLDYSNQHNNMDGIHVGGGCAYGAINNIYGTSNDDFVALNPGDATTRNATLRKAPSHDISVNNVFCENGYRAIRMLAGQSGVDDLYNISISNIFGSFRYGAILLSTYSTTTTAYYKNISISNVHCSSLGNFAIVTFQGNYSGATNLICDNIQITDITFIAKTGNISHVIDISAQSVVNDMSISNVNYSSADINLSTRYFISGNGTINNLNISDIVLKKPDNNPGLGYIASTVTITNLKAITCQINGNDQSTYGITKYVIDDVTMPSSAGSKMFTLAQEGITIPAGKNYYILSFLVFHRTAQAWYQMPVGAFQAGACDAFIMDRNGGTIDIRLATSGETAYADQNTKITILAI